MAIKPVVRYMLLCDDWHLDAANDRRITVYGLMTNIHATDEPPYPLLLEELCVFLVLTEGYGQGEGFATEWPPDTECRPVTLI